MREYSISKGTPYPLGVKVNTDNSINISFVSKSKDVVGINFYKNSADSVDKEPYIHIELNSENRIGNIYCANISGIDTDNMEYTFFEGDKEYCDQYSQLIIGNEKWGKVPNTLHSAIVKNEETDEASKNYPLKLKYSDSIIYLVHVRGFTNHKSSGVKNPGTFEGIIEKLPYLKNLGITTIELMPAYEFLETEYRSKDDKIPVINYWGYKEGYYFAPKSAYSAVGNAVLSFKDMVSKLHEAGMELIMQFNFMDKTNPGFILEVLKHWVFKYKVDGFHLMGENIPQVLLATNPMLSDTKLMYYNFPAWEIYDKEKPEYKNLAVYNDEFMYIIRRFLKSDEGQISGIISGMREVNEQLGKISCITNGNGFTLMDLVSYDRKHNEENGENNRDGNPYNASWNCGAEGNTNKKSIINLRRKQIKNAIIFNMFSQATPLIISGDEFGQSQKGNNNPYCIDSPLTWLNWQGLEKNSDIYDFYKTCIDIRKANPILHVEKPFRMSDYLSKGFPDLSFHGEEAWKVETDDLTRHFAMLYSSDYVEKKEEIEESSAAAGKEGLSRYNGKYIYIGVNMHWAEHTFALPALPNNLKWKKILDTSLLQSITNSEVKSRKKILIKERSIIVLIAK